MSIKGEGFDNHLVFAFGRKGAFFFEYRDQRKWNNLPQGFLDLLNTEDVEIKIRTVVCLSFTERGGWLVLYKAYSGSYQLSGSSDAPSVLKAWIKGKNTQFSSNFQQKTIRFSIGKEGKFFASAKGADGKAYYRWGGMPPHTEEVLQYYLASMPGHPRSTWSMAIGTGDDYVFYQHAIDSPETAVRTFSSKDKTLEEVRDLMSEFHDDLRGCYVSLNPYAIDHFFFLRRDGSADWKLKADGPCMKDIEEIARKILHDRQAKAPELNSKAMSV